MDSAHVIAWCEREKRKVAGVSWPKEHLEVRPDGKRGAGTPSWRPRSNIRRRIGCTRYDVCAQPNNPANGPLDVAPSASWTFTLQDPLQGCSVRFAFPSWLVGFLPHPSHHAQVGGYPMDKRAYAAAAIF